MKVTTADISGMSGVYEESCQKLLWTGIKYLSKIDNAFDLFKGSHGLNYKALGNTSLFGEIPMKKNDIVQIHGVLITPESLREMENEMSKAVNGDWSGMQHETVIGHLEKIAEHGLEWWLNDLGKDDPSRLYTIDLEELFGEK